MHPCLTYQNFGQCFYFSTGTKESRPPGISVIIQLIEYANILLSYKKWFGIVQKSGFQINKDPEYLSDSELFEQGK